MKRCWQKSKSQLYIGTVLEEKSESSTRQWRGGGGVRQGTLEGQPGISAGSSKTERRTKGVGGDGGPEGRAGLSFEEFEPLASSKPLGVRAFPRRNGLRQFEWSRRTELVVTKPFVVVVRNCQLFSHRFPFNRAARGHGFPVAIFFTAEPSADTSSRSAFPLLCYDLRADKTTRRRGLPKLSSGHEWTYVEANHALIRIGALGSALVAVGPRVCVSDRVAPLSEIVRGQFEPRLRIMGERFMHSSRVESGRVGSARSNTGVPALPTPENSSARVQSKHNLTTFVSVVETQPESSC